MTPGSGRREAVQQTVSPVDGSIYVERKLATDAQIAAALDAARKAQAAWRSESVEHAPRCSAASWTRSYPTARTSPSS